MGTIKGEYIAVKDLYGNWSGAGSVAIGLMYNTKVGRRALLNGIVKYDHWITTLTANDFAATAKGGNVKDLVAVESYGEDVMNVKHDLEVTFEPSVIAENKESNKKTINIVATQKGSNQKLNLVCTQEAGAEVITISVTNVSASTISASGGYSTVTISWSLYKNGVFYKSGTSNPNTIYGSSSYGAYVSGNQVYMKSAGTSYYSSARTVFTISSMNFYADGKLYEYNSSVVVKQQANVYSGSIYDISASTSSTSVPSSGGTFYVTAECYYYNTLTSGSTDYDNPVATQANVEYSNGVYNVSPSSFTGRTTIQVDVLENIMSSTRYPKIIVRSKDLSSAYDSVQLPQSGVTYQLEADNKNISVSSTTTSVTLTGKSLRNDFSEDINKKDVSIVDGYTISSPSISSVTTDLNGNFSIKVTFSSNSSTSNKNLSIKVIQPNSNNTLTYTITQAGQAQSTDYIKWLEGSGLWQGGAKFTFFATLLYHKSLHGTGKTVNVTPLRGSSSITNAKTYSLDGVQYDTNYYRKDIDMLITTANTGENFYLKADYGNDTDTIKLNESNEPL